MVYGRYNYSIHGVYEATFTSVHHPEKMGKSMGILTSLGKMETYLIKHTNIWGRNHFLEVDSGENHPTVQ
jgi:hypothetical protein